MLYWFTADSPPLPRIVLFTESAPSPVCRPIAHENAKCGQFFSCILNETGVYYCQRAMRYFGPEYMPSEAVFKLISLAKFRGILRLKPGFRHRGFESSTLRHFFCLDFKAKNMKPEKALLHTASAVLHILRQCRKMLHTPTGVLHPIRTSLFRWSNFVMKHFPFHSKYEAFASLIWCKNEKWEFRLQYFITDSILTNGY